jgi:hypothetical protein
MMAGAIITPGADWRPFEGKSTTPLVYDIICAHTEVGTNEGSIDIGSQPGHSYAHLYLAGTGYFAQCQDLRYRAAANLDGNWHIISWETEDMKGGVFPPTWTDPPWTEAQINTLVNGMAWQCVAFNIPPTLVPDTKPGRRGLAYHRQGIHGNFVPYDGIVPGGELWSSATGKSCPASRVEQFKTIVIPRIQAIVWGTPTPEPTLEELMKLGTFTLYNPNNTFWVIYPEERMALQIDGNDKGKLAADENVSDFALSVGGTGTILRAMDAYGINGELWPRQEPVLNAIVAPSDEDS